MAGHVVSTRDAYKENYDTIFKKKPIEKLKHDGCKESKSKNLRSWSLKDGTINPLFHKIKSQFPYSTARRDIWSGIWDGDGYQRNTATKAIDTNKTLKLCLDMAENGKEPVLMLAL